MAGIIFYLVPFITCPDLDADKDKILGLILQQDFHYANLNQ